MNTSKLPPLPLMGNHGVHVTQNITRPLISELDLIEAGVEKTRAKQTIRAAGGAPIGNRWFTTVEKFSAYLDAHGKATAPTPKAAKKPTTPKMTADEIAQAAGLSLVTRGGK